MISASQTVYNNSSRSVPLGMQLKPSATPIGDEFDDGILRNLYQIPVQPFRDQVSMLHGNANFCNTVGEIIPCYVSPSLMLNRNVCQILNRLNPRTLFKDYLEMEETRKLASSVTPIECFCLTKLILFPTRPALAFCRRHFAPVKSSA